MACASESTKVSAGKLLAEVYEKSMALFHDKARAQEDAMFFWLMGDLTSRGIKVIIFQNDDVDDLASSEGPIPFVVLMQLSNNPVLHPLKVIMDEREYVVVGMDDECRPRVGHRLRVLPTKLALAPADCFDFG